MAKDKDYIQMIHTMRWLRLRKDALARHPVCEDCEANGVLTPAMEVHHIRPVEEAMTYRDKEQRMYDPHNLRCLCHACHVRTHTELGRSGKEATQKRNKKHVKQIVSRFFGGDGAGL